MSTETPKQKLQRLFVEVNSLYRDACIDKPVYTEEQAMDMIVLLNNIMASCKNLELILKQNIK